MSLILLQSLGLLVSSHFSKHEDMLESKCGEVDKPQFEGLSCDDFRGFINDSTHFLYENTRFCIPFLVLPHE